MKARERPAPDGPAEGRLVLALLPREFYAAKFLLTRVIREVERRGELFSSSFCCQAEETAGVAALVSDG